LHPRATTPLPTFHSRLSSSTKACLCILYQVEEVF
jgi:hypothetical protein